MEGEKRCKKGLWTEEEDKNLIEYIKAHGKGRWNHLAKITGVKRSGKSCRLRWTNYLSPSIKHGNFSEEEEDLIVRLHNLLGNRWSLIAGRVPGRTDNQVKNHWNCHLSKKLGKNDNNKQKRKAKPISSSQIKSPEIIEKSVDVPMNTSSDTFLFNFVEGEGTPSTKIGSPWNIGIFETIEGNEKESYENSFWYWNDFPYTSSLI